MTEWEMPAELYAEQMTEDPGIEPYVAVTQPPGHRGPCGSTVNAPGQSRYPLCPCT